MTPPSRSGGDATDKNPSNQSGGSFDPTLPPPPPANADLPPEDPAPVGIEREPGQPPKANAGAPYAELQDQADRDLADSLPKDEPPAK